MSLTRHDPSGRSFDRIGTGPEIRRGIYLNASNHSLFRKEALQHRTERLHGEVNLAVPVAWQAIGYLLLAALAAALIFLATASYSRIETATGAIVLDRGVAAIVPSRPGIVADLLVREGQRVDQGRPLVRIRSEEDMTGGATMPERIVDSLGEQDRRLSSQVDLVRAAAAAEQARLGAQIRGLTQEIASLDAQIASQRRLVEVAAADFEASRRVAARGFVSVRDLDAREGALLARRQQLAQLDQARAAKRADLAEAERMIAQSAASAEAQAAGVLSSRAELAQRLAQAEASRGYSLTAPVAGTVTALTARLGQPAVAGEPLMIVMPAGARPRAELFVPSQAVGFLAVGQEVRLAVDAFPYQRFGTVTARIAEISSAAIPRRTADGGTMPAYLVTAEIETPWVAAFGRRQPLLPGMTFSARIVTERQSLIQWLFEPLFAVGSR